MVSGFRKIISRVFNFFIFFFKQKLNGKNRENVLNIVFFYRRRSIIIHVLAFFLFAASFLSFPFIALIFPTIFSMFRVYFCRQFWFNLGWCCMDDDFEFENGRFCGRAIHFYYLVIVCGAHHRIIVITVAVARRRASNSLLFIFFRFVFLLFSCRIDVVYALHSLRLWRGTHGMMVVG